MTDSYISNLCLCSVLHCQSSARYISKPSVSLTVHQSIMSFLDIAVHFYILHVLPFIQTTKRAVLISHPPILLTLFLMVAEKNALWATD